MTVTTDSAKLMITSEDQNSNNTRMTINFVNPEKFTVAAMESDTTLIPAVRAMFSLSTNSLVNVQFSQTYYLTE